MSEHIAPPAPNQVQEHDEMVGTYQPSENQIQRGAQEFTLIERERSDTWSRWKHVIVALNLIDELAMREAKTNVPRGGKFNRVVSTFLRCYRLDRIHKSDRSRIRKYAGKLELIDAWRAEQPPERQLELNHPRIVYDHWSRSLRSAASQSSEKKSEAKRPDVVADLVAALNKATDGEVTKALTLFGFDAFLRVMPSDWRPKLEARIVNLRAEAGQPALKVTAALRSALSLAKIAATYGISEPVASSNRHEALNALQKVNVLLAGAGFDLNGIIVSTAKAASKSRRRAA
jgi:hypothetical protein